MREVVWVREWETVEKEKEEEKGEGAEKMVEGKDRWEKKGCEVGMRSREGGG